MVGYGMVWYGMVWYGMVWCGTVLYSTVRYNSVESLGSEVWAVTRVTLGDHLFITVWGSGDSMEDSSGGGPAPLLEKGLENWGQVGLDS